MSMIKVFILLFSRFLRKFLTYRIQILSGPTIALNINSKILIICSKIHLGLEESTFPLFFENIDMLFFKKGFFMNIKDNNDDFSNKM
jgi:hypothetical protein